MVVVLYLELLETQNGIYLTKCKHLHLSQLSKAPFTVSRSLDNMASVVCGAILPIPPQTSEIGQINYNLEVLTSSQ